MSYIVIGIRQNHAQMQVELLTWMLIVTILQQNFYETGEAPSLEKLEADEDSSSLGKSESLDLMLSQSLEEHGQITGLKALSPSLERLRISRDARTDGMDGDKKREAMEYDIEPIPLQQIDSSSASPATIRTFFNEYEPICNFTSPHQITSQQQHIQQNNYHEGNSETLLTADGFHNEEQHWSLWESSQDSIHKREDGNSRKSLPNSGHSTNERNNNEKVTLGEPISFTRQYDETYPPDSHEQEFQASSHK